MAEAARSRISRRARSSASESGGRGRASCRALCIISRSLQWAVRSSSYCISASMPLTTFSRTSISRSKSAFWSSIRRTLYCPSSIFPATVSGQLIFLRPGAGSFGTCTDDTNISLCKIEPAIDDSRNGSRAADTTASPSRLGRGIFVSLLLRLYC
nr:unnamed protein product [Digitaria exilis]